MDFKFPQNLFLKKRFSIGDNAFYWCWGLKEVHISDLDAWWHIEFADTYSNPLYYAHNLYLNGNPVTELSVPEDITTIDTRFQNCTSITSVTIPENVTTIGDRAFYQCDSLKSVTIGTGVTTIGVNAFSESGLTSVTIPNSVTTIGKNAFFWCDSLKSVTIPNSVTSIGEFAFYCWGLKEVHISDLDAWWHIEFADTYSNPLYCAHNLYLNGSPVTELTIPEDITTIDTRFRNCTSITSITIPERITTIKSGTFSGCTGLQKFEGKFASDNGRCLVVNDTLVAFALSGLSSYTTPDNITAIGDSAFSGCDIKSITVSDNVTAIGNGAFLECDSLKSATIGSGVTAIGKIIFGYCFNITSITIYNPKQIKIDDVAFCEIDTITTLYVPEEAVEECKANEVFRFNTILPIVAYDFDAAPTMTPVEDDKTVTSLSTFTLTFDERPVLVNDSATMMKADSSAFYRARITKSDDGKSFIIVLQGKKQTRSDEYTLTEAGTYLLVIPAGTFGDDAFATDPNTGHCNPELVYTYTIKEPEPVEPDEPENPDKPDEPIVPDEPSSITETQAEAEHIAVYNLQGVLVLETNDAADLKTLQNGAYIVNGKKMIIVR